MARTRRLNQQLVGSVMNIIVLLNELFSLLSEILKINERN